MNIRKAISTDALLLSSLCMDVQRLHAVAHPEYFKVPQTEDFAEIFFETILGLDTSYIFIAEDKDDALGYVFSNLVEKPENPFIFTHRYLMIEQISVRPHVQRHGIGASLIREVEVAARDLGVKRIELGSWDFNLNAHRFFTRMGYEKQHYKFGKTVR
ncbi:MAG TPA: hypothetical protein DCX53_00370 [Anaerolineae bacterium]|nr:hypothetical protein [Anaerolineae bacterium]